MSSTCNLKAGRILKDRQNTTLDISGWAEEEYWSGLTGYHTLALFYFVLSCALKKTIVIIIAVIILKPGGSGSNPALLPAS